MSSKTWFVYMVRCRDQTMYTGCAVDVIKRIMVHNAGNGAKYTRARLPVKLVYQEACADRSTALKREAVIKKMTRKEKLALADQFFA